MSLPIYWPPHNPTHRLIYIPPTPPTPSDHGTMLITPPDVPSSTLPLLTRGPIRRHHPPPPPLTFSATFSAFPALSTPLPSPSPHHAPSWPASAGVPSLRSLLPRHLDMPHHPSIQQPTSTSSTDMPRKRIVHPPPLPPPHMQSQPASPMHLTVPKRSLRRLTELDYPLSAPLPHLKPSLSLMQHALMPVVCPVNDPFYGTPPAPMLAYDVTSPIARSMCAPLPSPMSRTVHVPSVVDVLPASPRARHCRSLTPTYGSSDDIRDGNSRSSSAPPVRPASPAYRDAVIYPAVPRIRPCSNVCGTHNCVLRSYELVMRQQPVHARMCGVGDKCELSTPLLTMRTCHVRY